MRQAVAAGFVLAAVVGCAEREAAVTTTAAPVQVAPTTTTFSTFPAAPVAVASVPAVRTGDSVLVAPTEPPPTIPPGLWGRPFAPEGLSDCDEMNFYREQWGLPERFSGIGWRESNCRNEDGVHTYCCYGYWQLYPTQHLKDHRLAPLYELCGVRSFDDYNSDTPIEKQRQACAAKALFDTVGYSAWSATS